MFFDSERFLRELLSMLSIYAYNDVRSFLQDEFQRRVTANSQYSLRSFARDLDITLSRISEVFSSGAGISLQTAQKVALRLGMSEHEKEFFELLVQSQYGRNKDVRQSATLKINNHIAKKNFQYLKESDGGILSQWYYLPLLEVLTINKEPDLAVLAKNFNIESDQLNRAVTHLEEKGFITKASHGRWVKTMPYIQVESSTPAKLIREYHLQLLKKAAEAVEGQKIENRKFLTSVFGVKKENLQEARRELERISQDFTKKYASEEASDCVYCVSLQFFQLDQS